MGFFGMELDQRNRGQRAMEEKTLVTGCTGDETEQKPRQTDFPWK